MHLVSVWLTDVGLTLAQVSTEEKSNEITAIPEVLRLVDINGAISFVPDLEVVAVPTEQFSEAEFGMRFSRENHRCHGNTNRHRRANY